MVNGIPSTSIERTLMDLCGRLPRRRAAIALDNALHRSLTTLGSLDHCLYLTARRGRNGCGILRQLIQQRNANQVPNSPLETVILDVISSSGLPIPELQYVIRDPSHRFVARPDFVYPEEKLVIQGHSKQWHWGVEAESKDLDQHNRLTELGFTLLYVTWTDATQRRERVVRTIETLLMERAA